MNKCNYGCGKEGKHQLKNGKWCCVEDWNKCPKIKEKRSKNHKGGFKKGYTYNTKTCSHCRKNISINHFENHQICCEFKKIDRNNLYCEMCNEPHDGSYGSGRFCSSKCARGFSTKDKREEINKKVSKELIGREISERIKKVCTICNKEFTVTQGKITQITCSMKCGDIQRGLSLSNRPSIEWTQRNQKRYENGFPPGGGNCKWYDYKDIRVQGTYELRTCKILDHWKDIGKIKDWEYTNDRYQYQWEDKTEHTYLIDFKVFRNDGSFYYLETKGFQREHDEEKWETIKKLGFDLKIWFNDDILIEERKMEK